MGNKSFCTVIVVTALALVACDDDSGARQNDIAKALSAPSEVNRAEKERKEQKKAAFRKKKQAKADAIAARVAEIKSAMRLPEPMPESIESACDAMIASYDTFMRGGDEREVIEYYDHKTKQLPLRKRRCLQRNNISASACGSVALLEPLEGLKGEPRGDTANAILQECIAFAPQK